MIFMFSKTLRCFLMNSHDVHQSSSCLSYSIVVHNLLSCSMILHHFQICLLYFQDFTQYFISFITGNVFHHFHHISFYFVIFIACHNTSSYFIILHLFHDISSYWSVFIISLVFNHVSSCLILPSFETRSVVFHLIFRSFTKLHATMNSLMVFYASNAVFSIMNSTLL